MFEDHYAKCHGGDTTDGEIFWLLKNRNLPKGMPTWAALPEPMRWQIIAYIKSLGPPRPPSLRC
jgi:hypothetical protein